MTVEPGWLPPEIDTGKANIARVYDYWLGGTSNFLADQDAARALLALEPNARGVARANRAFLGRAVRYLAGPAGIRQFLDIGSGIPTAGNVHEVAQQTAPGSRVVYADVDETVVAHSKLLLKDQPDAAVIGADLRQPEQILADPTVRAMIDFRQPVALLLVTVLHFVADEEDPWQLVSTLRGALPPGSYLVVCHACRDSRRSSASSTDSKSSIPAWSTYPCGDPIRPPIFLRTRANSGAWPVPAAGHPKADPAIRPLCLTKFNPPSKRERFAS
jgi:hypothetical protein